ncbi:MAG: hypothetical protein ABW321_20900, partial [Polyangiales bacterium]
MLQQPELFHEDQRVRVALWSNLVLVDVAGDMTVARMRRLGDAYRELLKHHPQGVAGLSIIRDGTPPAGADARKEAKRFMVELGDSLKQIAIVIESRSVSSQLLRSVIGTVAAVVLRSRFCFPETAEAAAVRVR